MQVRFEFRFQSVLIHFPLLRLLSPDYFEVNHAGPRFPFTPTFGIVLSHETPDASISASSVHTLIPVNPVIFLKTTTAI